MDSLSVVLPAYNEEENIMPSIKSIYKFLKPKFSKLEIIVVNDGSRDQTAKLVQEAKTKYPIKLINHPKNRGYGAALRSGFAAARNNLVFYTDSDLQFDISDFQKLQPLISKYDIVAGYRLNRQDPLMRIVIAHVYNAIIFLVFGLKIRDVDSSFKLYKRQVLQALKLTSETGLIDAEVLLKAKRANFSIGQVGVKHYPRLRGQTIYEIGNRNKIFAWVRPQVIVDLVREMRKLKTELKEHPGGLSKSTRLKQ